MDAEQLRAALRERDFSVLELAQLEAGLDSSVLTPAEQTEVGDLIRQKRSGGPRASAGSRQKQQDWLFFPAYLSDAVWEVLMRKESTDVEKLDVLCSYLVRMGLRHPTEHTEAVVTALLTMHVDTSKLAQQHPKFLTVKAELCSACSLGRPLAKDALCLHLPARPADAPASVLAEIQPAAPRLGLLEVLGRARQIPCRRSNKARSNSLQLLLAPLEVARTPWPPRSNSCMVPRSLKFWRAAVI